jgi:DNA polymerase-3 subunit epsilon
VVGRTVLRMIGSEVEIAVQQALWPALPETGPSRDDDLELAEVTFVVLDLETTGEAPAQGGITEIGAVKVRGGEVLGEFQTLVRPPRAIPAFITVLTGISNAMVAGAPELRVVLPTFLEFIRGCVLVAHNAPYDIGFLRAACERTGHDWPRATVVDTLSLARHLVPRDETPNRKLSSLARLFRSGTTPDHRALTDARATVDVLHGLLARVGAHRVRTLGDLRRYSRHVPETTRRKRTLADGLPAEPGVYLFHDEQGRVLYVGTSVNIRNRVRTYFTASEQRARMREMVARAAGVTPVPCCTPLEAGVRELRLIAQHAPPYNRRSRHPERSPWIKLTREPFPRLSVVRERRPDHATYLGPFSTRQQADQAVAALQEAFPIRRCGPRLPRRPSPTASACLLADIGRCGAPCVGRVDEAGYAPVVEAVRDAMTHQAVPVVSATMRRVETLAAGQRFEEAAVHRDRLLSYLRGAARGQRIGPIVASAQLIGARRRDRGGWELALVRFGRLAGASLSPPGADPMPYVSALDATGEVVTPPLSAGPVGPAASTVAPAHPGETELVLRWLEQPGTRLVELDGVWACPVAGAQSQLWGRA